MQIVINVSNHIYSYAIHHRYTEEDTHSVMDAIAKGDPLPEGHGDLIDKAALLKDRHQAIPVIQVINAPVIVKAE